VRERREVIAVVAFVAHQREDERDKMQLPARQHQHARGDIFMMRGKARHIRRHPAIGAARFGARNDRTRPNNLLNGHRISLLCISIRQAVVPAALCLKREAAQSDGVKPDLIALFHPLFLLGLPHVREGGAV